MKEIELTNKSEVRSFPLSFNSDNNTVDVIISTGERVLRTGFKPYFEELEISEKSIDMTRLKNGAPVLDSHRYDSIRDVIGVVENSYIRGKEAVATIRFSQRDGVKDIVEDVRNGIIKSVSIGYRINKAEKVDEVDDIPVYRATDFTIYEVSLVRNSSRYTFTNQKFI